MDLWNSAIGDTIQFHHRNPPALSNQDSPTHSASNLVLKEHRIIKVLETNTVFCEEKKWHSIYLRKLENHTNAQVANLLGNIEATQRLKSYILLTLSDRPK
jgi:hypothetical protein